MEAEVQEVIDEWANAVRAKNADRVVSLQTDDFVQFGLAPPLRAEALDRNGLEEWFSSWRGQIDYEIHGGNRPRALRPPTTAARWRPRGHRRKI